MFDIYLLFFGLLLEFKRAIKELSVFVFLIESYFIFFFVVVFLIFVYTYRTIDIFVSSLYIYNREFVILGKSSKHINVLLLLYIFDSSVKNTAADTNVTSGEAKHKTNDEYTVYIIVSCLASPLVLLLLVWICSCGIMRLQEIF